MKFLRNILLCMVAMYLAACSGSSGAGGAEIGNPAARVVIGQFLTASASEAAFLSNGCAVDTVIATDSLAQTTTASVSSDCSFDLSLEVNKAYSLGLVKDDSFIAAMVFRNSAQSLTGSTMVISAGSSSINLGTITISNGYAEPEFEPAEQNDRDGDGVSDYDDSDDDHTDCDLDGYIDDYDDDDSCDLSEDNSSDDSSDDSSSDDSSDDSSADSILDVNPKNGSSHVNVDEEIEFRSSCEIDSTTVNDATFVVESDVDVIDCDFEFSSDATEVRCQPLEDMSAQTEYTVTIEGVMCTDSSTLDLVTWSFTTRD